MCMWASMKPETSPKLVAPVAGAPVALTSASG